MKIILFRYAIFKGQPEVFADATIAWPLVVRAVIERMQGSERG
jgi:hypothetical protein